MKSRSLILRLQNIRRESGDGAVISYLRKCDPYVFEEMIMSSFERSGLMVKRGLQYSGDGGIDGMVKYEGRWYLIQAKRYGSHINPKHVADFDDLLQRKQLQGFFVHTGKTGGKSSKAINKSRAKIISGSTLVSMLLR